MRAKSRTIALPNAWAGSNARTVETTHTETHVEASPYHDETGTPAVALEIVTPEGYASVSLPLEAARLLARALLVGADEARDDFPDNLSAYRFRFGL